MCVGKLFYGGSDQYADHSRAGGSVKVSAHMVHAEFEYTWEYQGTAPKLVRTPLTDRCFLTLTQGMALGLGGNPYGPAGTGKTESVKALGQVSPHAFVRSCLLYTSPSPRDKRQSRMPSSA